MMYKCVALKRCWKSKSLVIQTNRFLTHYEVLGLNRDATHQEIKQAYKEKSLQLHPDVNQDDPTTHDRFIRVKEAYQVLSKDASREDYNNELEVIKIINMRSMMIENAEERYSRLHINFQNHFGVKIDREDFIKQYAAYERKKQQSCKTENIIHGWTSYITASTALLFVVTAAILVNENRKKHAEVQRSLGGRYSHMDERKQMFMKQLIDKEDKEIASFMTKFRAHRIQRRKEQIEFERWKYEENYRKQREKSKHKSKDNKAEKNNR